MAVWTGATGNGGWPPPLAYDGGNDSLGGRGTLRLRNGDDTLDGNPGNDFLEAGADSLNGSIALRMSPPPPRESPPPPPPPRRITSVASCSEPPRRSRGRFLHFPVILRWPLPTPESAGGGAPTRASP